MQTRIVIKSIVIAVLGLIYFVKFIFKKSDKDN
jgi:hypothetical protein